ncbi:MAG: DUF934 domain-containing protein [Burkholderiaceae bacterium]|nr:DUF934 domain-containing protein [Burkholderiaceae bacterium]
MRLLNPDDALPHGTVTLANTDDVAAHADALREAPAVTLHFPKWVDGRAYSQAVVLRGRLKYAGEIIATGEVMLDMLPLLRRCGFDAAQLVAGQDLAAADRALGFFPGHYQADPHRSVHA